jgi:hypothetical protein
MLDSILVDGICTVAKLLFIAESILDSWNALAAGIAPVATVLVLASNVGAATYQSSEAIWTGTVIAIGGDCLGVNVPGLVVILGMITKVSFSGNARSVEQTIQIAISCCLCYNESRQQRQKESGVCVCGLPHGLPWP